MSYIEEAQQALADFVLKDKILKVEKKYSTLVAQVTYNDKELLVTLRNGAVATYPDKPANVKKMFNTFAERYAKIKEDSANRDKFSLGKYYNEIKNK